MRNLFFLCCLVFTFKASAQDKDYPTISYDRWMIDGAFGYQLALNDLSADPITDALFSYENARYIELLSGTYFFNQEWGVNIAIQIGSFTETDKDRSNRLDEAVNSKYGSQYFIESYNPASFIDFKPTNAVSGMSYGLVYRYDKNKFRLLSMLDLGFRAFEVKDASYSLKEKGGNQVLNLSYLQDGAGGFLTFISPRIKCLYKLKDDIYLKLDVNYALLSSNFEIVEEITDSLNDEFTIRSISYRKTLHTIGFGIGIAFFL